MKSSAEILEAAKTIAVVGMSTDVTKPSHSVPLVMEKHGWKIIPVHPSASEIAGHKAYAKLADIPEPVDLVNVFRPSAEAADVTRQAISIGAKGVWLQLGIASPEARDLAEGAGIDYVEDHCVAVERAKTNLDKSGRPHPHLV